MAGRGVDLYVLGAPAARIASRTCGLPTYLGPWRRALGELDYRPRCFAGSSSTYPEVVRAAEYRQASAESAQAGAVAGRAALGTRALRRRLA